MHIFRHSARNHCRSFVKKANVIISLLIVHPANGPTAGSLVKSISWMHLCTANIFFDSLFSAIAYFRNFDIT